MSDATPDPDEAFVRLEREIGLLLRRARAISARLAGELHPDLDGAAYGLLALLEDAGPLRAGDLVARLGLDKSTVSRQVSHLADLGLVDRAADPVDGRAQVLTPSAEGSARLARIHELLEALDMSEARRMAAEAAVPAGYRRDLIPHSRPSSALVVWRPRER